MLLAGGCQDCYAFEQEPLLQSLRFVVESAGEIIYYPRSHNFDSSWFIPSATEAFVIEYAKDSTVLEPLAELMWNLGCRAAVAIQKELHGMLQDRVLVKVLEYAARDIKESEELAAQLGEAGQSQNSRLAAMNASLNRVIREWEATFDSELSSGCNFNIGSDGPLYPITPYCPACGTECSIHRIIAHRRPRRRWLRLWPREM